MWKEQKNPKHPDGPPTELRRTESGGKKKKKKSKQNLPLGTPQ